MKAEVRRQKYEGILTLCLLPLALLKGMVKNGDYKLKIKITGNSNPMQTRLPPGIGFANKQV
jgi:hypothetical protein